MRIFVTGATGFLGSHIAAALARAGHQVLGMTRSPAKARWLAAREIEPVVAALQEPAGYRPAAASCAVIVHAAVDYGADVFAVDRLAVETLLGVSAEMLIYTSGIWVYGATGRQAADELTPIAPAARVIKRPEMERLALSSPEVRGIVTRPGCVYGGAGGMFGDWFEPLARGEAPTIVGTGANHWPLVHADDLGEAYRLIAESSLAGQIINITDRSRETVSAMVAAASEAAGFTGKPRHVSVEDAAKASGSYAECLTLDQHVDSSKAARLLGWQPRHGGFSDRAATYYRSWQASQTP